MKKFKSLISISTCAAAAIACVPFSASAEGDVVYGTMNIPYADFYRAELADAGNAYEVDAVSSATTTKVFKNGEGELFEGTYNEEVSTGEKNPAGNEIKGRILGVTYPVAISQADLDALGSNNYSFTKLDAAPSAYKNVTVSDGKASFSAVQDSTPVTAADSSVKLSTETAWGDYLIDIVNAPSDLGAIYGALVKTADGNKYAFRHEQNIWRGEIAWSSGIKTSEPHGNSLDFEDYKSLMGSTITEVVFITKEGYTTVNTNTFVPVKFSSEIKIENGTAGTGKTTFTATGIPADYAKAYTVGEGFTVTDGEISYTNAKPGSYTLSITDGSNKYAPLSGSFTLTTDDLPVKYADGKLVPADGFTEEDAANFIKNISAVNVNDTKYSASGRGAVKIIDAEGVVNKEASSRNGNVFAEGTNTVKVQAAGYTKELSFEIGADAQSSTTTTTSGSSTSTTTTTRTSGNTTTGTNSPKTGVADSAVPTAILSAAAAAAFLFRKRID